MQAPLMMIKLRLEFISKWVDFQEREKLDFTSGQLLMLRVDDG